MIEETVRRARWSRLVAVMIGVMISAGFVSLLAVLCWGLPGYRVVMFYDGDVAWDQVVQIGAEPADLAFDLRAPSESKWEAVLSFDRAPLEAVLEPSSLDVPVVITMPCSILITASPERIDGDGLPLALAEFEERSLAEGDRSVGFAADRVTYYIHRIQIPAGDYAVRVHFDAREDGRTFLCQFRLVRNPVSSGIRIIRPMETEAFRVPE